jgi:hypothetical protein
VDADAEASPECEGGAAEALGTDEPALAPVAVIGSAVEPESAASAPARGAAATAAAREESARVFITEAGLKAAAGVGVGAAGTAEASAAGVCPVCFASEAACCLEMLSSASLSAALASSPGAMVGTQMPR